MDKIVCFILCFCVFWFDVFANQSERKLKRNNVREALQPVFQNSTIQSLEKFVTEIAETNQTPTTEQPQPIFTKWTPWSRCEYCYQVRTKKCISPKCKKSKIYEERPCNKKRCKRKRRRKHEEDFRVVQVEESMQKARTSRSRVWSKWSKWSKCSKQCRTFRYRVCKKAEKCKKRRQRQSAFCYHDNTRCENYVLSLLDMNNNRRISYENNSNKYEYNKPESHGSQQHTTVRPPKCGRIRRKTKMLKIIGGMESKKYKWPWHVAVINRYREVFCAGTLIAPRWVLTAGHCIRNFLRIRLNEHDLVAIDGRELEMTVQKMFLHPRFNHQTVDNDIALLRLPKSVKVPPVCLPSIQPQTDELCSIMGWGKLNSSDEYGTTKLHEAKIPVVEWEACTKAYRRYVLTPNMFCAGWASGAADTCAGDSGGGLMCPPEKGSKLKGYSIQGITSFGDGCGRKNKFGIYTMVYNYIGWINYVIETYS